jgi:hypothetical protein
MGPRLGRPCGKALEPNAWIAAEFSGAKEKFIVCPERGKT